jgi:hypothetical protein
MESTPHIKVRPGKTKNIRFWRAKGIRNSGLCLPTPSQLYTGAKQFVRATRRGSWFHATKDHIQLGKAPKSHSFDGMGPNTTPPPPSCTFVLLINHISLSCYFSWFFWQWPHLRCCTPKLRNITQPLVTFTLKRMTFTIYKLYILKNWKRNWLSKK